MQSFRLTPDYYFIGLLVPNEVAASDAQKRSQRRSRAYLQVRDDVGNSLKEYLGFAGSNGTREHMMLRSGGGREIAVLPVAVGGAAAVALLVPASFPPTRTQLRAAASSASWIYVIISCSCRCAQAPSTCPPPEATRHRRPGRRRQ